MIQTSIKLIKKKTACDCCLNWKNGYKKQGIENVMCAVLAIDNTNYCEYCLNVFFHFCREQVLDRAYDYHDTHINPLDYSKPYK